MRAQLGSTLRMLRVDAGLSVRSLARKIGVSSAYLSRVENGHDPVPTPQRLIDLAKALELPPSLVLELAHKTGPALAEYLERVPAANGFFLEVARRDLDANQLAKLRQFMDTELGPERTARPDLQPLRKLVGNRIILDADCASIATAVKLGAARLVRSERRATALASEILERERSFPTVIGDGVCVPHATAPWAQTAMATLVTLSTPLTGDTPDGIPVQVILVLVSPTGGHAHLEALAEIARLASHHLIDRIHAATTPSHVKAVFRELELTAA